VDNASFRIIAPGNIAVTLAGGFSSYGVGAPGDANSERGLFTHDGAALIIRALASGTGGNRPIHFMIGSTVRLILNTSGELELGIGGPKIRSGNGSPEAAITAPIGSMYLRADGGAATSLYVKESGAGNTGWVGK
jgi:hypothetical protein